MSPRIAVALRIKRRGVRCTDGPGDAAVLRADIVIEGISDLAAVKAAGEIPDQSVVNWEGGDRRQEGVVPTPQKVEFFFHQRRRLVHETVDRGSFRTIDLI